MITHREPSALGPTARPRRRCWRASASVRPARRRRRRVHLGVGLPRLVQAGRRRGPDGGPGSGRPGIEIRLDPHFKTYWRTPGDIGLPPSFDWSGSENVRSVEVRWPAAGALRGRGGILHRLQGGRGAAAARDARESRQARHAEPQARLRGLRADLHSRSRARPACSWVGSPAQPFAPAVAAAEARAPVRKPAGSGRGRPSIEAVDGRGGRQVDRRVGRAPARRRPGGALRRGRAGLAVRRRRPSSRTSRRGTPGG